MIADPARAPARTDLPFLRHRARPRPAAPTAAPAAAAAPAAPAAPADQRTDAQIRAAIADFVNGRSKHPDRATAAPAGGQPISFDRPGRSHGVPPVTRSRPAAPSTPAAVPASPAASPAASPVASPPAARSGGSGLSFERPGRAPAPAAPSGGGSLDLDAPAARPAAAPGGGSLDLSAAPAPAVRRPVRSPRRLPAGARVRAGQQQLLTVAEPTVLLGPLQSGIGQLGIEAACGPAVGDLRLGAAYQLRSGPTSIVQLAGNGNRFAPSSRRPVIVAGRDEYEHLRVDLRQVPDLLRMAVYAFSESRTELTWGGTLVVTTFGGARIELPLEALYPGRIAVLISLYNVDGRLVVRAEMETIAGDVREAARAYGYDRITWRDDRTPVD